jgi:hypothetical protein
MILRFPATSRNKRISSSMNEEITSSPNPEEPVTESMEIHHKHHHDAPGHKEKLWKHYLFEFLMLFLAVSAGFGGESKSGIWEHNRQDNCILSLQRR